MANVWRRKTTAIPVFAATAISQEVIDVLAVVNALQAARPPKLIHDL